ncbi:MAG: hypothetical protein U0641_05275 [Anaerolineae bacterium]
MKGVLPFVLTVLRYWLAPAAAATLLAFMIYVVAQQSMRLSANDVGVQVAEDTAAALEGGQAPAALTGAPVDLGRSLAPFTIIYDDSGQVVAASARLDGATPGLPAGVLDNVRARGESRLTWQPQPGVRLATVITRVGGASPGFVAAGRSLREVERRIDELGLLVGVAWLATLGVTLVVAALAAALGLAREQRELAARPG